MNFSQFSYLRIFGLWKPSICVRILLLVGLITPYLQAQDIDCIRTVVPLVGGQGQMTPPNQIPIGTIGGANDKQYYPNLYAVEYYRPDVFILLVVEPIPCHLAPRLMISWFVAMRLFG